MRHGLAFGQRIATLLRSFQNLQMMRRLRGRCGRRRRCRTLQHIGRISITDASIIAVQVQLGITRIMVVGHESCCAGVHRRSHNHIVL